MQINDKSRALSMSPDERFRLLVNAVTDYAIFMLDRNGVVASWNPGAQRIKGYAPEEIIGQHFSRFYTDEDKAIGIPAIALHKAEHEGRFEAEGWRVRRDGTRFWASVVIDPVRGDDGELIGFAKVTRDLTERRATEEALRQSEERFRLLIQSVTDYAIYMLDADGHVSNWNAGAQRIKGYVPDEIVGQHFSRFYTDEDRERGLPQRGLATAAREGRFEAEGWRVRKDGTRFWAHVIIDPIRDERGTIIGFAKVTRDITERREAQRALEQAREALFQAQKMEAIGQLTGGVAHDFNNLLTAVLGSLELLRKRVPDDPKIMRLIDNAVQGAERGASLTQRMLAFARRQDLDLSEVDIPSLVRGMADLLQRSLGPNIAIETRFPLRLDKVTADPNQVELALLNLAVNARDAMPEGGLLSIGARKEQVGGEKGPLAAGEYVVVSVTDQGTGMDEETLARATEPFFTTKGVGKGTGLGLSMVHGLAEQSGGRLVLHSQPGAGTTAELWLPVAEISQEVQEEAAVLAKEDWKPATQALSILVVDDDSLVLGNTAAMLDDLGHQVLEATSGKQALDILSREGQVDLVLTDYSMPGMTGLELAQAIAAERPELPVVLMTGYADLASGVEHELPKLSKPFRQEDLAQALQDIVARRETPGRIVKFRARRSNGSK